MAKPDLHGDIDFGNLNQSISLAAREQPESAWAVRYFDDVTALRLYVLKLEGQLAAQAAPSDQGDQGVFYLTFNSLPHSRFTSRKAAEQEAARRGGAPEWTVEVQVDDR